VASQQLTKKLPAQMQALAQVVVPVVCFLMVCLVF
jgi:hypothetical protein